MKHEARTGRQWKVTRPIATGLFLSACQAATGLEDLNHIEHASPIQVVPVSDPSFAAVPGSTMVFAKLLVADSALHVQWRPSRLIVESSTAYRDTVMMAPYTCLRLDSLNPGLPFPANFEWRDCDRVVWLTLVPLSDNRLLQIGDLISGTVHERSVFANPLPEPFLGVRAKYTFLIPVGQEATAEALRRLAAQAESFGADRGLSTPTCVISDALPPPPCPPWHLQARLRYSFSTTPGRDSIPVQPGGWIRVTYPGADGSMRSATYSIPP
jgi:hypothetical protein